MCHPAKQSPSTTINIHPQNTSAQPVNSTGIIGNRHRNPELKIQKCTNTTFQREHGYVSEWVSPNIIRAEQSEQEPGRATKQSTDEYSAVLIKIEGGLACPPINRRVFTISHRTLATGR